MRYFLLLLFALFFSACKPPRDQQANDVAAAIQNVNKNFAVGNADSAGILKAEISIRDFVMQYPDDTLSPKYLFQLGLIQEKQERYGEALTTLDQVYQKYPDSKAAPNAIFLEGFLYANELNNLDKAKEKYQLYLDKYAGVDPKVTGDVQMEIRNLGKSPDQILKEIQEKASADSIKGN